MDCVIPLYVDFVLAWDYALCFLLLHETKCPSTITWYLIVDLQLILDPAQSAFEKHLIFRLPMIYMQYTTP